MVYLLNPTRVILVFSLMLSVVVLPFGTGVGAQSVVPDYWPTNGWRTSDPEAQGMNSTLLDEMTAFIENGVENLSWALHSFLVIRNGYIVYEYYSLPYDQDTLHFLASATKTFVAALIGIALDAGIIGSINDTVVDIFDDRPIANMDARKEAITIRHLLTMTPGLAWDNDNGYNIMIASPDWVQYVLDLPMIADPGETWAYNSGASHLLSAIIQQLSGTTTLAFAENRLFGPLGIDQYLWETDPQGIPNGGAGMELTPRNMAKLGLLYLENGQWDGQQLLPEDFVAASCTIQSHLTTDPDGNPASGYGYQTWVYPYLDAYGARGSGGQRILVVPDHELVIVTTGNDAQLVPLADLLLDYVYASIYQSPALPLVPWQGVVLVALVIGAPLAVGAIYLIRKFRFRKNSHKVLKEGEELEK
ncbi:MAG: serine hydrolase domain-containing protein [Promethearchaeota archaeon]